MRPKILLLDEPCVRAIEILEQEFELTSKYLEAYAIWTGLSTIESSLPVFCPCTGIDHIKARKVIYLDEEWRSGEGRKITSTAEHTWSLILQLAKLNKMQLANKTIGIIGYGRIGSQVAKYATAFKMKWVRHDNKFHWMWDFERVLKESDIITLHVPLDAKTKDMIGKSELDLMKPNTLLINTSRAEIVDEDALVEALCNNKIGGYADDFKDSMRQINNYYLRGCSNVIQTPHIGGNCIEAREATDIYIAKKAVEYWRSRNS